MLPNDLDELYKEVILDHYRHPRNSQRLEDAQVTAHGFNPFCGDEVDLQLRLNGDGAVREVGFQGRGCSISQASASLLTEELKGKTLAEAEALRGTFRRMMQGEKLTDAETESLGGLAVLAGVRQFPVRIKCALLSFAALEDGIKEHARRQRRK
ncbi:MAG: SUF system NifU family Fe-S cluster assembly protein [Chloroflexi bacterium]|nr:SUF system NifU family Fe-S cluster assembly protein [Chloroflexota bacterium]